MKGKGKKGEKYNERREGRGNKEKEKKNPTARLKPAILRIQPAKCLHHLKV